MVWGAKLTMSIIIFVISLALLPCYFCFVLTYIKALRSMRENGEEKEAKCKRALAGLRAQSRAIRLSGLINKSSEETPV
jgi:hypothetical protein